MPSLILPSRFNQQPQHATGIDWANPLTRGLKVAINPAAGLVNLSTGRLLTAVTALPVIAAGQAGLHLPFVSGSAGNVVVTDYYPGAISEHSGFVLARSSATAGEAAYISTRRTANKGFGFTVRGSGSTGTVPNQTAPIRYTHAAIIDYEFTPAVSRFGAEFVGVGFSATNSSDVRTFVRGAFMQAVATGTMNTSTDPIMIGGDPFYSQGAAVDVPLVLYWNRRLTDAEHAAIAANPWQVFAAPQRRLWIAAGSVIDTQVIPGAAAVTLAGYAPSVAQTTTRIVAPAPSSLILTGYAPSVTQSSASTFSPAQAAVVLTGYAPAVTRTENLTLSPAPAQIALTGYAPTVAQVSASQVLTPAPAMLTLTGFAPSVTQTGQQTGGGGIAWLNAYDQMHRRRHKKRRDDDEIKPVDVAQRTQTTPIININPAQLVARMKKAENMVLARESEAYQRIVSELLAQASAKARALQEDEDDVMLLLM